MSMTSDLMMTQDGTLSSNTPRETSGYPTTGTGKFEDEAKAESCREIENKESVEKSTQLIKRVDKVWDKTTRNWRYQKTVDGKKFTKKSDRYVIVLAQCFSFGGKPNGWEIQVRGEHLRVALSKIFQDHSYLFESSPLFLERGSEQRYLFYGYWELKKDLDNAQQRSESTFGENQDRLIKELKAGTEFIYEHWNSEFEALKSFKEHGNIAFSNLWVIFNPGELVYSLDGLGQGRVYRVKSCHQNETKEGTPIWRIEAMYLDFDGTSFGYPQAAVFIIEMFHSEKIFTELVVYPFYKHPNFESEKKNLICRGQKAVRLHGQTLQEYEGYALSGESKKFYSKGRVILDPSTARKTEAKDIFVAPIQQRVKDELTNQDFMMISSTLYGFNLADKRWGCFDVSLLCDVQWNGSVIDSLVLHPRQKSILRSAVKNHALSEDQKFDDIVRGKGKGLVGILSGPPGVGKTLTAEAIAEDAHMALYTIGSGELGASCETIETRLRDILKLAQAWNAVVLLDEADVFLVKRDNQNLERNAITSIFLRELEYYGGILILTTNRLDSLDPAFESRLDFSFAYGHLDPSTRKQIWQIFTEKASSNGNTVEVSEAEMDQLSMLEVNGRRIKAIMKLCNLTAKDAHHPITFETITETLEFNSWKENN